MKLVVSRRKSWNFKVSVDFEHFFWLFAKDFIVIKVKFFVKINIETNLKETKQENIKRIA